MKRRSSTISGGRSGDFTKKSITNLGLGGGGDVNRFQSFKKLVQTKILSKSDRSLVELQPAIGKISHRMLFFMENLEKIVCQIDLAELSRRRNSLYIWMDFRLILRIF